MFGMTSLVTYSMFTWIPDILADAGASPAFGGAMVGLFALLGLVSAFGAPSLCARMTNPFPVVVACASCFLVAFAGLWIAPMSAPILWIVLLGLGPSTFPMALTLINLRSRSHAGSAACRDSPRVSATPWRAWARCCSVSSTTSPRAGRPRSPS